MNVANAIPRQLLAYYDYGTQHVRVGIDGSTRIMQEQGYNRCYSLYHSLSPLLQQMPLSLPPRLPSHGEVLRRACGGHRSAEKIV